MLAMRMTIEELEELKKVLGTVEEPNEVLTKVMEQIDIALFQEKFEAENWFKWLETDGVYQSFDVDREEGKVWFFDPDEQREMWVSIEEIAPATNEEIQEAEQHYEKMNKRYEERCKIIEEYLAKKYPNGTFAPVEWLKDEGFPRYIEIDGKVYGRYVWSGWPNSYHYTVNMTE